MAEKNRGMGRGLAAILSVSDPTHDGQEELRSLPLDLISPSPNQPRKSFDTPSATVALHCASRSISSVS